jgi:uncharacterized protein (DUF849 family)
MSLHLPVTPDEITAGSIPAAKDGTAIEHLQAHDPKTIGQSPMQAYSCSSCRRSSKRATPFSTFPEVD